MQLLSESLSNIDNRIVPRHDEDESKETSSDMAVCLSRVIARTIVIIM